MSQDGKKVVKVLCGAFGLTLAIVGLVFLWFSRDSIIDMMAEGQLSYSALKADLDGLHNATIEEDIIIEKIMVLTGAGFFVFGLILLLIALLVGRKKPKKEKVGLSDTLRHGSPEFEKYMNDVIKKLSEEQKSEIIYLIYGGRTIEAIKLFRDTTGVGLAHAKDVIDHYNIYLK